ncbi:NHLP leader peptide family RiPP precursor [Spirosoma arcticum]
MEQRKQEIIEVVISKAWEDANFRKELITDPVQAIEKLTGVKVAVPEGKSLVFLDQTDKSKIYVNIPAEPEVENMELTEEQLEAVAGGGQKIWGDFVKGLFPKFGDCITL